MFWGGPRAGVGIAHYTRDSELGAQVLRHVALLPGVTQPRSPLKDQVNGGGGGPVTQGQSDLRGKGSPQSAEQSLLQPRPPGMPGPLPQALQVSKPLAFAGVES